MASFRESSEFRVREAREEEWEAYRDLRLASLASDPLAFGSTLERERPFPPEKWRERLRRDRSTPGTATWVAIDRTGEFVGTAAIAEFEGALHLFAMWVAPAVRGRGVGRQILDAALERVQSARSGASVVLEVNPRQEAAVHLYEARGFRRTGRSSPLGHTAGEVVIEMSLTLDARPSDG